MTNNEISKEELLAWAKEKCAQSKREWVTPRSAYDAPRYEALIALLSQPAKQPAPSEGALEMVAESIREVFQGFGPIYENHLERAARAAIAAIRQHESSGLREAAQDTLDRYVDIANSGDCGFWDPEKEPHVIALRQALAKESR
jgi:hypothetical protein